MRITNGATGAVAWLAALIIGLVSTAALAQPVPPLDQRSTDAVIGPQDVLTITSYDQSDLSGKFAVESDGTFTFPLIGRVIAGGLTRSALERDMAVRLKNDGYFINPQIAITVESNRSQRVFVLGEVRAPGTYVISRDMSLIEAIARAGSTLPTAAGDILVVHDSGTDHARPPALVPTDGNNVLHVDLLALQSGRLAQKIELMDGDTIFVPRVHTVYVSGQVRSPGMYAVQQNATTVLQALALAGGVTERGSTARVKIRRVGGGTEREIKVQLSDTVQAGDTIIVPERFF
jgi:polysaccharide export outer membrane protein